MSREEDTVGAPAYRHDERQIEFDDPNEIPYWLKFFDTSKDELFAAVSAVGTSACAVAEYLRAKRGD